MKRMFKNVNFRRWLKYKYLTFMRIKDHPKNIAVGTALGIAFDVLPTFGMGVVIAYFLAAVIKVNRLAALISAVVFKLAIPFFVFINIKTGQLVMKSPVKGPSPELVESWHRGISWTHLGASFLVGSAINAVVLAVVAYFVTYQFVLWRRSRVANRQQ
jgi:hypothetical protein